MTMDNIAHPPITTREGWKAQRKALLAEEKELTKQRDALNARRRRLPMVRLEKEYLFQGPDGPVSLKELFAGKTQLITYHFMFHPDWEKGCMGCTSFVDALGDLSLLDERNTTFALVSRAPIEKLQKYKAERGWDRTWLSSFDSDFNFDFHVTFDESKVPVEYNFRTKEEMEARGEWHFGSGEAHGISVFFLMDGDVYHTYSAYARGVESITDAYQLLDITPYGRQEDFEDSPEGWPQKPTYGG